MLPRGLDARRRRIAAALLLPGLAGAAALAVQVIADDLIVGGRGCVGLDCVDGEAFDVDTLRLKENNLRIQFEDSSDGGVAPANAWRITANDSRNGGASQFSIDDLDASTTPFASGADVTADADSTLAVALADLDGDGALDLVAANDGQPNRIYLGDGSLDPFASAAGADLTLDAHATTSVAIADFDFDFRLDVVAGNDGQPNRLYLNDAQPVPFSTTVGVEVTSDAHVTSGIAAADVNGDFRPDVLVANLGQPNRVYLNNGTATPFAGVVGSDLGADVHQTTSIAVGDVDGDLLPDVVVGNRGEPNRLYLNNGTATPFAGAVGIDITSDAHDTMAIALGDADGDGLLDVVAGNDLQPNRLYLNAGAPAFFSAGVDVSGDAHATFAIALVDVDGDGPPDVVAGNFGQPNRFYQNNGTAAPFLAVPGADLTADAHATTSLTAEGVQTFGVVRSPHLVVGNLGEPNRIYFPLDSDGGTSPVVVAAGAPDRSLHLDAAGRLGVGTDAPDADSRLHVAGELHVGGDLVLNAGTRSGVVPASAFAGGKTATVAFAAPQAGDYVVILTPVGARARARLLPAVIARDASGFTLTRGGKLRDLLEIRWVTRPVGEF